jgi:outer membrane protein assembly factor BamE (lipoprotein component of BamABCDE complex)
MECDMKKILTLSLIFLAFSWPASADTIIFRDGMRVEVSEAWEKNGEVKCKIGDIVFGYPKDEVERIETGRLRDNKAAAPILKVHKEVTVIPQKEMAIQKKDTARPKKEAAIPNKQTVTPKKAVSIPKKEKAKKAVVSEYAGLPSFKVIINEDDNNPPVYIKRRRVLLVPRGLAKAQIRTLLLSYEKRTELKAQKAKYKQIMIWTYDDFERADEGAGGWVGMITNEPKTGKLSDNPKLSLK